MTAHIPFVDDDAPSTVRPYKTAFPQDMVLTIMKEETDSRFDPAVYDAFRRSIGICREILGRFPDEMAA